MPKTLPDGVYIQVYRGKVPGNSHLSRLQWIADRLDGVSRVARSLVKGIVWHGFTLELTAEVFEDWAHLCQQRGLLSLAAFGLDATDPVGKGKRMAEVASVPTCAGIVVDSEDAWDVGRQSEALAMGESFRKSAPDALVIDQSWPVPTVHSQFPYEQFDGFVDATGRYVEYVDLHAEQRYYNEASWVRQYGKRRYAQLESWFDASEAKIDALLPQAAKRPHIRTIQGYGWDDIPDELEACLTKHHTCLVWSEPWPDDTFWHVLDRIEPNPPAPTPVP